MAAGLGIRASEVSLSSQIEKSCKMNQQMKRVTLSAAFRKESPSKKAGKEKAMYCEAL